MGARTDGVSSPAARTDTNEALSDDRFRPPSRWISKRMNVWVPQHADAGSGRTYA